MRRRPGENAAFVHALLTDLETRGFPGAPRFLGIDAEGREVLSYMEGEVPLELGEFSDVAVAHGARLLRALHDATAESSLRGEAEVVCHGDASPCNAVFRDGVPWAFIDFDAAHSGARRDDIGYAAWLWLDLGNTDLIAARQGMRLGAFVRAYGGFPIHDAVQAVLDAQAELCARATEPSIREWATRCRAWIESHRADLVRATVAAYHGG